MTLLLVLCVEERCWTALEVTWPSPLRITTGFETYLRLTTLLPPAEGGMPMNSSLTATLSEFSRKSEFSKNPLAAAPSDRPTRRLAARNVIAKALGKLFSFAVARVLLIFFIGFAAGLAWQSYGGAARKAIGGWSPRL